MITSLASSAEELPKSENESSKTLHVQESKESGIKRNNLVKRLIKKKKIDRRSANNNQKNTFHRDISSIITNISSSIPFSDIHVYPLP